VGLVAHGETAGGAHEGRRRGGTGMNAMAVLAAVWFGFLVAVGVAFC
jgi:hypothetical protein